MSAKLETHVISGADVAGGDLAISYHFDDGRTLARYSEQSSRSINELMHWTPRTDDLSEWALIQDCETAQKAPLDRLSVKQVHLLLTQKIALDLMVPRALDILQHNHCITASLHAGDLLKAVLDVPPEFWGDNPRLRWVAENLLAEFCAVGATIEASRKSFLEFSNVEERP